MKIFAERLKELRLESKLSQRQLAEKIGMSDKAVSLWEKGERVPSLEAASLIAKFFKVSIDYLAGFED